MAIPSAPRPISCTTNYGIYLGSDTIPTDFYNSSDVLYLPTSDYDSIVKPVEVKPQIIQRKDENYKSIESRNRRHWSLSRDVRKTNGIKRHTRDI